MKIQVMSDLHMDTQQWSPQKTDSDVIVVAGDLYDDGRQSIKWCRRLADSHEKPVLFVPGNHDFQGATLGRRVKEMRELANYSGVTLLLNRTWQLQDVLFVGTTLWTDFAACGDAWASIAEKAAQTAMVDFSTIFVKEANSAAKTLRPRDTVKLHERGLRAIQSAMNTASSRALVVVTHHAPSLSSTSSLYENSLLNAAYASRLDNMIAYSNIDLWVHGHVHSNKDYRIGNTRVVCNPRGPRGNNPFFEETLVIEV